MKLALNVKEMEEQELEIKTMYSSQRTVEFALSEAELAFNKYTLCCAQSQNS